MKNDHRIGKSVVYPKDTRKGTQLVSSRVVSVAGNKATLENGDKIELQGHNNKALQV